MSVQKPPMKPRIGHYNVVLYICQACDIFNYIIFLVAYLLSLVSRQSIHSDLPNKQFLLLWHSPLLCYKVSCLDLSLRLTKLHQRGCPRSSFSVRLAPCLLPLPHCSSGSHSLATASLVPRAPCPRRVPVSPSGAPLSPRAQPLPTIPPQVRLIYFYKRIIFPYLHYFLCTIKYYYYYI